MNDGFGGATCDGVNVVVMLGILTFKATNPHALGSYSDGISYHVNPQGLTPIASGSLFHRSQGETMWLVRPQYGTKPLHKPRIVDTSGTLIRDTDKTNRKICINPDSGQTTRSRRTYWRGHWVKMRMLCQIKVSLQTWISSGHLPDYPGVLPICAVYGGL